jgi:hypothetical protein
MLIIFLALTLSATEPAFDRQAASAIGSLTASIQDSRSKGVPCGINSLCFYDDSGRLVYWTTEYIETYQPLKRTVITAYTSLQERQEAHNQEMADLGATQPQWLVNPNGHLNLTTLGLPHQPAKVKFLKLWAGLVERCRAEAGSRAFNGCSAALQDYFPNDGTEPAAEWHEFPSQNLRIQAILIIKGIAACRRFFVAVEELRPLTRRWNSIADPAWTRQKENDHLETDQIPSGFYQRLEKLRLEMTGRLADAEFMGKELNP